MNKVENKNNVFFSCGRSDCFGCKDGICIPLSEAYLDENKCKFYKSKKEQETEDTKSRLFYAKDVLNAVKLYRKGLSELDVAAEIGCSQCTIHKWIVALGIDTRNKKKTAESADAD